MKIAITGATGFLGHYIVHHMAAHGHACRCWYRPDSDRGGFEAVERQIEWVPGELGDPGAGIRLVEGCDAVVHAALYHPGGGFRGGEGDVLDFVEKNMLGTLQLIEAARQAGVGRFVFISIRGGQPGRAGPFRSRGFTAGSARCGQWAGRQVLFEPDNRLVGIAASQTDNADPADRRSGDA